MCVCNKAYSPLDDTCLSSGSTPSILPRSIAVILNGNGTEKAQTATIYNPKVGTWQLIELYITSVTGVDAITRHHVRSTVQDNLNE